MAMLSSIQPAFPRWLRSAAANFVDATKLVLEHSSAWASIILALLTAGTLWVGAWYMADQDASRTQTAAFNDTENLARAFEENIIRLIQAYDQTLLFARSSYATSPEDFDLAKWAHEQHFVTDAALQIVIIGKSGVLADSTLGRPKTPMDLSDREHFRVHVTDAKDFLYISPPVFGRLSKKWSIQMSRRIYGPNGSFDGVILVAIDPLYLERFFESIDVTKKGMVLLSGLDGIVRARASADDRTIGQSILSGSLFAHLRYEKSGSFVTTGERDGTARFTSYRKVRGYPLVVAVGVARSAAFANIRYRRILYYSTALLVSLLIFVLTGMIVRRQIRLHRAAEKLWESANFDYLTKLPNRNKLNNEVSRLLAPAVGEQRQFALLLLDLDNFKLVNDTLGHEAGDVVLCAVANRLRDMARSSDFIARLGGDEFALLVNNAEAHNLGGLAQRILYELRRKMDYRGQSIEMCVSLGIAFFPNHGSTWADIFRAADLALYQAKKGGRNQSVVFEPRMRAEAEKRFDVLGSVRSAIEQHRIVPYYQPQICIESGEVVGFEALARIVDGDGKIRTPDEFLSALDDPAVARMFGHQMIQAACLDFAYGANNGIHINRVAINVSALELRADDYADRVLAALNAGEVAADRIDIEITESVALDGSISVIEANLNKLRDHGVTISLDDFGTGYASLTHIKALPIKSVKIDRSFIVNLAHDKDSHAIVRAITRLSHNLGKLVLAEGVDSPDQLDVLRKLGCDIVQGYLISKPMPFSEIPAFLSQHRAGPSLFRNLAA